MHFQRNSETFFIGRNMNLFLAQSTGTIIDVKTERIVFWPFSDPTLASQCSWPCLEKHPMLTALMECDLNFIGEFLN